LLAIVLGTVVSAGIGLFTSAVKSEYRAWSPWVARSLTRMAGRLRPERRDEWLADLVFLQETGAGGSALYALRVMSASANMKIRSSLRLVLFIALAIVVPATAISVSRLVRGTDATGVASSLLSVGAALVSLAAAQKYVRSLRVSRLERPLELIREGENAITHFRHIAPTVERAIAWTETRALLNEALVQRLAILRGLKAEFEELTADIEEALDTLPLYASELLGGPTSAEVTPSRVMKLMAIHRELHDVHSQCVRMAEQLEELVRVQVRGHEH
jgi:hypothetical protein